MYFSAKVIVILGKNKLICVTLHKYRTCGAALAMGVVVTAEMAGKEILIWIIGKLH